MIAYRLSSSSTLPMSSSSTYVSTLKFAFSPHRSIKIPSSSCAAKISTLSQASVSLASSPASAAASTSTTSASNIKSKYDAVIVGGGHNGLVTAAYLAKSGLSVLVLEKRHVIGGAAITEELVPGFKFSRASYLLSLLRPTVINDLELKKHGLKVHLRNPSSFTPLLDGRYLLMGSNEADNHKEIAKFSERDAEMYPKYEATLDRMARAIDPLLDNAPIDVSQLSSGSLLQKFKYLNSISAVATAGAKLLPDIASFYEILTAPAAKILDRWFDSEPLKSTLATDAVIGAFVSPYSAGSGYVLFHHVMGGAEGIRGAWGYAQGGMGAVSRAIGDSAMNLGASVLTNATVSSIVIDESSNKVKGVKLGDGTFIESSYVLSNATPKITFLDLIPQSALPTSFVRGIKGIDYESPVTKINIAINKLPNFTALPNKGPNVPGPHHQTTIHLGCVTMPEIHSAYRVAKEEGRPSDLPVIEMCIPSVLDPTISPPGQHVVSLFVQYTPYKLAKGSWDVPGTKEAFFDKVCSIIEKHAPGFKSSIVGYDMLTPPDLERVFGLTGGNIFHGSMTLDQLYFIRPTPQNSSYRTPVKGLYLCGSGAHPGGGVMGAAGRNAAMTLLSDMKR